MTRHLSSPEIPVLTGSPANAESGFLRLFHRNGLLMQRDATGVEQQVNRPEWGVLDLNAGTTVWDRNNGAFGGIGTFVERPWDNFAASSALVTRTGEGLDLTNPALTGRLALITANIGLDAAISNRLQIVGHVMNGTTVIARGSNYAVRDANIDEGSMAIPMRPLVIDGTQTLTLELSFDQDGTNNNANNAVEANCWFAVVII